MKTNAYKVSQVLRIADKIQALSKEHPNEARRAARYFALWVCIINKRPIFQQSKRGQI